MNEVTDDFMEILGMTISAQILELFFGHVLKCNVILILR